MNAQGVEVAERFLPYDRVGIYIPGGKAPLVSTSIMTGGFAQAAGVREIVAATPCGPDGRVNPALLYALKASGATEIVKIGGAQAIAALALGTESVKPVEKIFGPGNRFVVEAKRQLVGAVAIDLLPGPSEVMVLADETATPRYVAADLLSQAEHDELASAILITTSKELAEKVSEEVDGFVKVLERAPIIQKSLDNYGYILLAESMEDAIDAANAIASEHLEIITKNPFDTMTRIRNAGAIFLGEYASEPLGDYFAGPNHILPTNGTARFFSPVNQENQYHFLFQTGSGEST